jgi:hypothetical protein
MPTSSPVLSAPSAAEVKKLATEWYQKLDVHAPLVELLPLVAEDARFKFPEATLKGQADFEGWYERVIRLFFDEVHTLKSVDVVQTGGDANVKVVVHWEASVWTPPAAKSQRIKLDAFQTWVVRRCGETERPVIAKYVVDNLEFEKDSARL